MRSARKIFESGFTLIELLVVLVVLAVAASLATLSLSATGGGYALESTAERLATTLEAARWQAIAAGGRVAWEAPNLAAGATDNSAPEGRWYEQTRDGTWQLRVTDVAAAGLAGLSISLAQPRAAEGTPARLVLGPEPVGVAACVLLTLERSTVAIVSDGVAPFAVRRDAQC
jgi:general secretion pathway protein H